MGELGGCTELIGDFDGLDLFVFMRIGGECGADGVGFGLACCKYVVEQCYGYGGGYLGGEAELGRFAQTGFAWCGHEGLQKG